MPGHLKRSPNGYAIKVEGWKLDRCCVGYSVTLYFANPDPEHDRGSELLIGSHFIVDQGEGHSEQLHAESAPERLGPVLGLLKRTVKSAEVARDGTLRILFSESGKIKVPPDPNFEAWQIDGPDFFAVCVPGGGDLAIWSGDRSSSEVLAVERNLRTGDEDTS
jgi:hypothetical protein